MSIPEKEQRSREEVQFYKIGMYREFEQILHRVLGENREHLTPDDGTAFHLLMTVIWNGLSHQEAAEGICDPQDLIDRHKEWAATTVLGQFLFSYPALHFRLKGLENGES